MKTRNQLMLEEAERDLLANKALQTAIVKYQCYYKRANRGTTLTTQEYLEITSERLIEKILTLEEEIEDLTKFDEEIDAFIGSILEQNKQGEKK